MALYAYDSDRYALQSSKRNDEALPDARPLSKNKHLLRWVEKIAELTTPAAIHWVDGSKEEYDWLCAEMVRAGTFIKLNEELWPGCYYARSDASDVARVEDRTFICSLSKDSAGPTNNWDEPVRDAAQAEARFSTAAMRGRTMYVLPFSMGPVGSPMSQIGVQLTDSPYVVVNMRIMARIGLPVFQEIDKDFKRVVPCMHSVGAPLAAGPEGCSVAVQHRKSTSCTFPETREIWSYGSGYGGNALLGKKCFALRIASNIARDEGWMAEHMLILGVENPQGEKTYVAAAFPSACGKTNFAMLVPPDGFEGWKVWTVGDDIAWIKPDAKGRLARDQSRSGILRRRAGHVGEDQSQRHGHARAQYDLHQCRAHARRRRLVGRHDRRRRPPNASTGRASSGRRRSAKTPARRPRIRIRVSRRPHRNARRSTRRGKIRTACRSARFIFGGRRATTMPLVYQAFNWSAGVYVGATMGSEMTAAAAGTIGKVRRDPMAMLPFCGYHMGDYFRHWIKMQRSLKTTPRIFHVNWFRKDAEGKFIWPGFRENMRVLKWIVDRAHGRALGHETPIGWMPRYEDIEWKGLDVPEGKIRTSCRPSTATAGGAR